MKILAFTDIHGNLNSLKALLQTEDFASADKVIFLGDVMFGCSRPDECINLLKARNIVCLVGNNDYYTFDHIPLSAQNEFLRGKGVQMEYMRKLLSKENAEEMKTWAQDLSLTVDGKKLYFTHYAWRQEGEEKNTAEIPEKQTASIMEKLFDIDADYIFYGHEHKSAEFHTKRKHLYCVGTLGLNRVGEYIVISIENKEMKVERKYVESDILEEIDLMDKIGYPYSKKKIKID